MAHARRRDRAPAGGGMTHVGTTRIAGSHRASLGRPHAYRTAERRRSRGVLRWADRQSRALARSGRPGQVTDPLRRLMTGSDWPAAIDTPGGPTTTRYVDVVQLYTTYADMGEVPPERAWSALRALRTATPGLAVRADRRRVFSSALEQAEQLFGAAASVGVATKPLLAFYGSRRRAGRSQPCTQPMRGGCRGTASEQEGSTGGGSRWPN